MIRTKCPHCGKLLGINASAAGTVASCPICKQKFRVPGAKAAGAPPGKAPAPPRPAAAKPPSSAKTRPTVFPEVEVDEEASVSRRQPPAAQGRKRPRPPEDDEEVAELDYDENEEEDRPKPKKKPGSKKKKKRRGGDETDPMVLRNRITGSVGAVAGLALIAVGAMKYLPDSISDPSVSQLGEAAKYTWLVTITFGALLVIVGVFYVFKTE